MYDFVQILEEEENPIGWLIDLVLSSNDVSKFRAAVWHKNP